MNYGKASYEDLEKIWNRDIEENKDDKRYNKWKDLTDYDEGGFL